MNLATRIATLISAALLLAGCGGAATSAPPVTTVNPLSPSYASLQFAVGTANLYGTSRGLNVVSTFRQTGGESATGVNTPTISGALAITAPAQPAYSELSGNAGFPDPYATVFSGGPSIREFNGNSIGGTPQSVLAGTPSCDQTGPVPTGFVSCPSGLSPNTTTFGQSGGVFAMGLGPYNAVAATGQAYSYQPYPQPFYGQQDASSIDYQFIPWGGPPAFDPDGTGLGERDGAGSINGVDSFGDPYFLGVGEGITAFDGVTAGSGTYTLAVAIATVGNGGAVSTSSLTKTATLNAATVLPAITSPTFTPDGNGGGSFTLTLPAGVTEAEVQIVDYGPQGGPDEAAPASKPLNCQAARGTQFAPVYYTIIAKPGTTNYTLPDTIGPNTATSGGKADIVPSPSICTAAQNNTATSGTSTVGDDVVIQVIGFDYPAYEAALGLTQATTPENPTIVGSSGQADVTISQASEQDNGATAAPVLLTTQMRKLHAHGPFTPLVRHIR
jgi:hypothetical protein